MLKYKIPQIVTLTRYYPVDPSQRRRLTRRYTVSVQKTKILYKAFVEDLCDRDRIQTCNRLIRSQLLYSVELRGQSLYFRLNFILKW